MGRKKLKPKIIKSILFFTIGVSSTSVVTPMVLSSCGKQRDQQVVHVTNVTLNKDKLELAEGETAQLKATILPTNATNKNVIWTSSNESIATVDQSGKVKAVSKGTATITVTTKDGGYTATCLVTVTEKAVPVTGVTLDKDKLELPEGDAAQLIATVLPENATNKKVIWSSSDPSTASVDQNGNVTAIATGWLWPGTATITATTEDGGYAATCKVTVTEKIIPVTSVTLDKDKLELDKGTTAQLKATVLPENATYKNVTWRSSNESIATVDQNGKVTAKSVENATVTVTTEDGGYMAICKVTVIEKVIPVTSVSLDNDRLDLIEGGTGQLTATVLPDDATNKNVAWKSSDESIATVDQNGNVTAKTSGNATITVTTEDGSKKDTCEVTITEKAVPVTGVTLDKDRLELDQGTTTQLKATVLPENATNKSVTWKSSTESVATVDQNGNVKAVSEGIATITVTTEDGSKTDTCEVTVTAKAIPVTSVSLDNGRLDLIEGEAAQLTATVLPEDATNKNVTWKSSTPSIATVDQSGNIKAVSEGIATITVTTEDGSKKDTCEVNVAKKVIPVTSVSLNKNKLEMVEGEAAQLTATVLPENATNKSVTWKSSTESVATVDQNGNIKAISGGYTYVYVITVDGNKIDSCEVIVTKKVIPVTGVTLDKDKLGLYEDETVQLIPTVLPENATNKNIIWSSSNESVATVDQNGNVTAIAAGGWGPGLAIITATTEDGGYKADCVVTVSPPVEVGKNYDTWGNITVKYKLLSNHECRLLTKFHGDGENGYVDGAGVLRIPDHVVYNGEVYYVRRIPSEWSDGENDVNGIEFESNVSHLKEICDYAFKGTNALDNYHHKILTFPEGLQYIGTEAFYNVDRSGNNEMYGIDFPSTLRAINVRAFANAGLLGDRQGTAGYASLTFRGNFNPENMREEAFSPIRFKNIVKYIYAPTIEIATNIANYIRVCYEDDFFSYYFLPLLNPKVIGS